MLDTNTRHLVKQNGQFLLVSYILMIAILINSCISENVNKTLIVLDTGPICENGSPIFETFHPKVVSHHFVVMNNVLFLHY